MNTPHDEEFSLDAFREDIAGLGVGDLEAAADKLLSCLKDNVGDPVTVEQMLRAIVTRAAAKIVKAELAKRNTP